MRRYTSDNPIPGSALYAWQELGSSVYRDNPSRVRSLMVHRPGFGSNPSVSNFVSFICV